MLSIIVPCYNEAKNLQLILDSFAKQVKSPADFELILVNNGSTDESAKLLKQLLPKYSFARTVLVKKNQGYGYGILCGLAEAKGEFLGWTHADLQTDPQDVFKSFKIIKQHKYAAQIFVKGKRSGRKFFDNFFTMGMSIFESLLLKTRLWEINAQPNIFHRDFYAMWKNPPHDFSLDLYVYYLAKQKKLNIIRLNVLFPERIHGQSSWNNSLADKLQLIKKTISYSIKLRKTL